MNQRNKKFKLIFIIALCFIIGGYLSFESLARFTQKFDASKTVSSAKFDIEAIRNFEDAINVMPGDIIGEDKITLKNDNDYPVEFTVKLKSKNKSNNGSKKDLLSLLSLSVNIDNKEQEIKDQYEIILESGETKEIITKVEWPLGEDEEVDAEVASEATAVYLYDIKAKQLSKNSSEDGNAGNGGEGNGDSEVDKPGEITPPPSDEFLSSITLKDITWKATKTENQNKIKVTDNYTEVGTNSNAVLENFKFDLKNEKIIFDADIELLNTNNTEGKGVNFTMGVKENDESVRNNLTYQLYKNKEEGNENIYAKVTNSSKPLTPKEIARDGNGGEIISSLNVRLTGEIIERENFVYAKVSIVDKNGNEIKSGELKCGQYKSTDKMYINITSIMGQEGIKINSMEVKAV